MDTFVHPRLPVTRYHHFPRIRINKKYIINAIRSLVNFLGKCYDGVQRLVKEVNAYSSETRKSYLAD